MRAPRQRHRPGAKTSAVSVFVALLSVVVATAHTPAQAPARTGAQLQLVAQQFAIEADGTIRLDYRLTGLTGDQLELAPDPAPPGTALPDTTPADTTPATSSSSPRTLRRRTPHRRTPHRPTPHREA